MPHVSEGFKLAMAYWVGVLSNPNSPDKQKSLAAREVQKLEAVRKRKLRGKGREKVAPDGVPVAAPVDDKVQQMLKQAKSGGDNADKLSEGSN